ncbi:MULTISPECIES: PadR family transcriptional regulator [Gordonia]|uniref:PadR family transcriptional regulator n=2 Tax=Gordonia TaxID=2053 RepID=A0ABP5U8T9_9ACTN|nr:MULTISPECIES: PadR family transcriptional regulator [Gordonia]AUH69374.1 PadR family transcriptional regulator [Gordonia sp. YC-JH1]KJR05138.1 PadR family transcriptional regulator [Gordonia sihwensis]KXT56599.1 PadR family transcriptional regulator [Gordonia sp. QH-12]MBY4571770.1 PadR family transcriptional regulator [Gordonia sihwensis]WFN94304.1 PadR family transcriptional regulator [Gordonia sihwensis]
MALEHAILVSLSERPGTGYEIGQQFSRSIGYFWSATHQQIYRTLKKLHSDGLVSFESVAQDGRPDKKVYTLSQAGRDMLAEWVNSPTPLPPLRSDLGVKLRAADLGDLPTVMAELRAHRDEAAAMLEVYRGWVEQYYPDPDALSGRKLNQYLVLRGGVRMSEQTVDWCDEVLDRFQRELERSAAVAAPQH